MKPKIYCSVKRLFDIVFSLILLVIASPVFLITAIGIKLSSQGPVFYIAERVGQGRKPFRFLKFRSMHLYSGKDKELFIADEERVFPLGSFIRKAKIDELPQLLNVLRGEMSFVGPRPMEAKSVDRIYCGPYEKITDIIPGLTSIASLYDYTVGDKCTDNDEYIKTILPVKLELELLYLEKRSVMLDLRLIVSTAWIIMSTVGGKQDFALPGEYYLAREKLAETGRESGSAAI